MLSKAIEKLKAEIENNKTNAYIHVVGGFLLQHLDKHPESAEKILTEDKTIAKSLDEMRKAAEKKKVGSCAVLTDQEGFEIVLRYFGIDSIVAVPPCNNISKSDDFDIKLEDLL